MKRTALPRASLESLQAWQRRTRDDAIAARAQGTGTTAKARRTSRRRNDARWRQLCLDTWGNWCFVPDCLHPQPVQMDHLIPRAHGGPSVIENGCPLCRVHHQRKTDHELLVDPDWLDIRHLIWLRDNGYAWWRPDGIVTGPRCRIFTDTTPGHSLYG